MRVTSWNLLHGMAIPPSNDLAADQIKLGEAIQAIGADVIGIQEVDEQLARSGNVSQTAVVAEAMSTQHWAFAPVMVGAPGEKWRKLNSLDAKVITIENVQANRQSNVDGNYGIGIVSKIPVQHWDRLELGNSPFGMPLVIPAENKKGKQSVRMIYVADEPRVALAATLDNGWTVINTHLSFVPFVNYRQLRKIKKWAAELAAKHGTQALIIGDLNLPKGLPAVGSKWNSLVEQNSYPSWGGKVQFDYILSDSLKLDQYEALPTLNTGVSDHLPVRAHIL
ncbi:MAG: endonuclease/exonuclease/phosphatase family protein [Candidatus Planktophila sp.]